MTTKRCPPNLGNFWKTAGIFCYNNIISSQKFESHCKDCRKKHNKTRSKIRIEWGNSKSKFDQYYDHLKITESCRKDPDNPELLQVKCKYCNNWFNPTNNQVQHRIYALNTGFRNKVGENNLYCSNACKKSCSTYRTRKYERGHAPATSREVQPELRKIVLERDNWTCQKCGKSKKDNPELILHCHHIFPLNENPIESADVDTCITYCKECHIKVHNSTPGCQLKELRCSI